MSTRKTRVFISFDYDHDRDLKNLLVGQSKNEDTPFVFQDWSIKQETPGWKADARRRIQRSGLVIVICGLHTHEAAGVAAEVSIAKDEHVPYYLLRGRKEGWVRRPKGTSMWWDEIHPWKWDKLRTITKVKL
jgi:hypothetical protein